MQIPQRSIRSGIVGAGTTLPTWWSDHIIYEEDKQVSRGCSAFSRGHRMALATNGFFFVVGERGNFGKEVSCRVC